jgi:asparagine synthase (glutamine-hydrolysing)
MCGIAGILLAPSAADPDRLGAAEAMALRLRHRGPDGGGCWSDPQAAVALAHRRLAIVDLSSAGHQPMASSSGRLVVTFNGEIYNFRDLRAQIAAAGHRFRGHSDTEVMLAAFERYGIAGALDRLVGMFALGLWDRGTRMLHLVRDRLGKKPLHVTLVDGALLFASELKAFQAVPGFRPTVDPRAVAMVLRRGWIPDDLCIWREVIKVPPGAMLSVRAEDLEAGDVEVLRARMRRWWSSTEMARVGSATPPGGDDAAQIAELDALLRTAVGERMVADVPLGAFLSGGIDSATVVALMQAQSARPVRTFTIGFAEHGYDEADPAAQVARHLGTEHTTFRVTAAEARAVIPALPQIWDEPFADESQIPTYLVARLARSHVTVALSGDGGDEGFGGYRRHAAAALLERTRGWPAWLRAGGAAALRGLRPDAGTGAARWGKFAGALAARNEHQLYDALVGIGGAPLAEDPGVRGDVPVPDLPDLASRIMFRDTIDYLPGDILVKLDRASMAVSLEARCPLLDHRVLDFAWRLPPAARRRDGRGKWLLRQVLRRYVPDTLVDRPKHGFDLPIGPWLSGPLRDWAEDLLAPHRLREQGFLDPARVGAAWQRHLSGRPDGAQGLWAALMVSAWLAEPVAGARRTAVPAMAASGEGLARTTDSVGDLS